MQMLISAAPKKTLIPKKTPSNCNNKSLISPPGEKETNKPQTETKQTPKNPTKQNQNQYHKQKQQINKTTPPCFL